MHISAHTHVSTHGYCIFGSVLFTSLRISPMLVLKNYLTLTRVYFGVKQNYSSVLLWTTYRGEKVISNRSISPECQFKTFLFKVRKKSLFYLFFSLLQLGFLFALFCMFLPFSYIIVIYHEIPPSSNNRGLTYSC